MNELSPDTPRCKKHKDRPAIIRSDGRSSGKCRECMRCSTKETWSNKYDHETIKKELEDALAKTGGSRAAASRLLGISEASLYRRVKKYGMTLPPAQCGTAAVLAIAGGAEDQAKRTPVVGPAPVIGAELQAAAERVDRLLVIEHGELGPYGDLVLAAKELTTTLRLAARLGAIPGWPGEKE